MKKQNHNIVENPKNEKLVSKRGNIFWHLVDRLASRSDFIAKLYEKTVGKEYRKEKEEFSLKKSKKVLHIGCGSYPITALTLSDISDIKVVTIDQNKKSVDIANQVIKRKNLEKKISAKNGEGGKYSLQDFDTIIISGCSVPKIQVIYHVFENAKKNSRIIIREALFKDMIINIIKNRKDLKLEKKIKNRAFPTSSWESLLIYKIK